MDEIEDAGFTLYAISPDPAENHQVIADQYDLDFDILTDVQGEFGFTHEFIEEDQTIYRGYVAANPDSNELAKEIDYLPGENIEEVLDVLESMQD